MEKLKKMQALAAAAAVWATLASHVPAEAWATARELWALFAGLL